MIKQPSLTRRHYLAASGAGVLALGLGSTHGVAAPETIKQGYQTNISKSTISRRKSLPCRPAISPCSRW
jgi:hypothetical protein